LLITWFFVGGVGGVVSKSRGKDLGKSRVELRIDSQGKDQVKSQSRSRVKSQGELSTKSQGDVDTVLVGRRVSIAVVVGDRVARVVGTIVAMGRYWVVVSVEESEVPALQGTVYLNKGSIVAYIPLPDNDTKP